MSRVRSEHGFTMIEVLVAAVILVLVVAASSALFVRGSDASLSSQRESQAISVADQEIETIRQEVKTKGFDSLAMSSLPSSGTSGTLANQGLAGLGNTHTDPNYFVSTGLTSCGSSNAGYAIEADWDDTSQGPAPGVTPWSNCTNTGSVVDEPLEALSGGFVSPQQTAVAVGSFTATIDTYVTDTYVGCNSSLGSCPTTTSGSVSGCTWPSGTTASTTCADARRVIVAVVVNNTYASNHRAEIGPNSPVYVSTVFTNPNPSNSPDNPAGVTLGLNIG
jgi:prepilin-type N-terminal cleavage/methylation domain-containing protein